MEYSLTEKKLFKNLLFKYQDGLCLTPIIVALDQKGIFDFIAQREEESFGLELIYPLLDKVNKGYLNVAFRSLASQGLFTYHVNNSTSEVCLIKTDKFYRFIKFKFLYNDYYKVYEPYLKMLKSDFSTALNLDKNVVDLSKKLQNYKANYKEQSYVLNEVLLHLEGVLLAPLLVFLRFNELSVNKIEAFLLERTHLKLLFEHQGLLQNNKLTSKGTYLIEKSYALGVTVSYWPLITDTPKLLFGRFDKLFEHDLKGNEQHVFRDINVWGSGGSHSTYFKKIDAIIIDLFNRPLPEQPKGIIDIGCGNGAFIEYIFDIIWHQTARRKDLKDNPLFLVGSDYNKEALEVTKRNLEKSDIRAEVIWGDIGDPDSIDKQLKEKHNIALSDLLNIRSFLDHNRPFNPPKQQPNFLSKSTGAFSSKGKQLNNNDVEQSLIDHLKKWQPHIYKYGLLLLELHTVSPNIVCKNLGNTPCTAYDVTHGFSDQYIVEIEVFKSAVKRAGLQFDDKNCYAFPSKDYSTISINLLY